MQPFFQMGSLPKPGAGDESKPPAAVVALASEEALIPAAAGFDICHGEEGLRAHGDAPKWNCEVADTSTRVVSNGGLLFAHPAFDFSPFP
jgi:hypothetical protein